ncbi:hypothetical protein [Chryseobacterium sp. ERMR1:04]|uniref:hypothetical protein n=1 Tax=Chryseobacterium sp. ERMR1:04 TaxID=1705393 RepID=UPI0006C84272|nr:hypothetical protein [Chryseobacterium sp. ERMR1:04]KPH12008.1 hypothetical protein AMQ68_21965 [Chryseobacterium sp. ERMR1:04]
MKHFIFLFLLIIISCKKNHPKVSITPKDENLDLRYEVLNQLIIDEQKGDSLMLANENFGHDYVYNISCKKIYLETEISNADEPPPPPGLGINLEYDSIFSQKDSAYYKKEEKILSHFKFNKNRIKTNLQYTTDEEIYKIRQIKPNDFWTEFDKRYKNKCIRTFSVPFFNRDKNICIIQNSMSCRPLYGGGAITIYQKINGKWKIINSFDHWVS